MAERVRITDVSPRDGLQNEAGFVPTAEKVRLIELLSGTGVDEVEVTSFVSPKWVPQLGDSKEVLEGAQPTRRRALSPSHCSPMFSALVPNDVGMRAALEFAGPPGQSALEKIALFTAASETFAIRNTNSSVAGTLERFVAVMGMNASPDDAAVTAFVVRGYISCAIACPFEGLVLPEAVGRVATDLYRLGVDEIDLADTIGAGTPANMASMIEGVIGAFGAIGVSRARLLPMLTLHLHDTFGRAADCVKAALDLGVRSFDGAVGGLGGCPYASAPGKRAPGNIDTMLLVETIHEAGYESGVDLDRLAEAAAFAREIVARARAGASP